jgi:phosphatidylserine/phosphatidylglycerophosphate/cardiolipin synthase-like enzyme
MAKAKTRKSGSYECKPVRGKCENSRDGQGNPITLTKKCVWCKEMRCKAHCKCARDKQLEGRNKARPGLKGVAPSQKHVVQQQVQQQVQPSAAAVADAAAISLKLFSGEDWLHRLIRDIKNAKEVLMVMYCFDDFQLHKELMAHRERGGVLKLVLDEKYIKEHPEKWCHASTLIKKGGMVRVKNGIHKPGVMHQKLVVLDVQSEKIVYFGTANATRASRINDDSMLRLTGEENVADLVKKAQKAFRDAWEHE